MNFYLQTEIFMCTYVIYVMYVCMYVWSAFDPSAIFYRSIRLGVDSPI